MKRFKVIIMLLIMGLLLKGNMTTASTETNHIELAELLKEAGFFRGSDKGFELDRQPSRAEGAVMLVRMLGKEEYVLSHEFKHPFLDVPTWADSYIGYLYTNGITKGIESNKYGSKNIMTVEQYRVSGCNACIRKGVRPQTIQTILLNCSSLCGARESSEKMALKSS